ncbi:MBL fold metallo-hydrolase [Conyzicola nivalis]|uniref:MBL fold metallo-hydrolase n=1 Tax=Conyzicola nivalis TaxID=1477021 RepID=A0A916SP24_9MICO|nr:MBL fold metallo-hydrolase [Conyzicola nivalis]GGB06084.1 MBL fold metallo-hydrolase [Conyzicola nivalis]
MTRSIRSINPAADGVFFVEGPASNWVVLVGDGRSALIDAGYPADLPLVEDSLRDVAGDVPLEAIVVTHGHSDHIGSANALVASHPGVRVFAGADELPNVRREVLHQVGVPDLVPQLLKPRFVSWAVHAVRAGGLGDVGVQQVEAVPASMTIAGHRIRAVTTPGHTPGHTLYELPDAHAVALGDSLVTGHAVSRREGLQTLHPMFHHDAVAAESAGATLARTYSGWTLMPGHGAIRKAGI